MKGESSKLKGGRGKRKCARAPFELIELNRLEDGSLFIGNGFAQIETFQTIPSASNIYDRINRIIGIVTF